MEKILITGGAGFIGSYLAKRYLDTGSKVTVLDNLSTGLLKNLDSVINDRNLDFKIGSVLDSNLVDKLVKKSDLVLHLAAVVGVKHM